MKTRSRTRNALGAAMLLACGAAGAQETGSPSATAITTADCEEAWADSAASSSCTTTVLDAEEAPGSDIVNNCVVKANCAATAGGAHDTFSDYHGGPDGVKTLRNCSGTLKTSC